ncbi:MAG: hypothetical protein KBA06_05315 [Saprospiraceae bacterium]|nr:hypothetical protein [Saprospiraceae bacterium]
MYKSISTSVFATMMLLLFAFSSYGQKSQKQHIKPVASNIQVIQFHSEHRCMTCNLIEKLTRETLKQNYPNVPFLLVNVDDSNNEKMAEEFEATGTALFIYNTSIKKKKDLTDFAFMNAKSNPEAYKKGVKKEIDALK